MLKFLSLVSVLVIVESSYLGNFGLGTSGLLGGNGVSGTSGYAVGLNNGGSYGIGNGGSGLGTGIGNSGYSYGSISGGSNNLGGGGNGAGNGANGAVVGLSTIPAGPAHTIPTAFSTQSRFDIIHPGSIVQQTVSQVPVVSTHIRPVAVAVSHGHRAHH